MSHVKKVGRPVDGSDVADSGSDVVLSFEFGLSRVTSSDLDDYAKATWFAHDPARPSGMRPLLTLNMMRFSFSRHFLRLAEVFAASACHWRSEEVKSQVPPIEPI